MAEPKMTFDRKVLEPRLANNEVPHGFILSYLFSNSVAFAVVFDETGAVTEVHDEETMADLLQYK